jgi:hypothetical protein
VSLVQQIAVIEYLNNGLKGDAKYSDYKTMHFCGAWGGTPLNYSGILIRLFM